MEHFYSNRHTKRAYKFLKIIYISSDAVFVLENDKGEEDRFNMQSFFENFDYIGRPENAPHLEVDKLYELSDMGLAINLAKRRWGFFD